MTFTKTTLQSLVASLAIGLMTIGNAHAVIVIDSGVDETRQRFVIDSANSQVTYDSGSIGFSFDGGLSQPSAQTFTIAGDFDVAFQRHWWRYYLDGDVTGSQGTFETASHWMQFGNPVLQSSGLPTDFEFPTYFLFRFDDATFTGSNGPCSVPMGPDTFCSGNSQFQSQLSGTFESGRLRFDGSQPNAQFVFGGGYTYHIEATVVPLPGTWSLFASTLAIFGWMRERRRPNC